jgi:hypothetical protein
MDLAPRPRTVKCARCNRSIKVAKTGRLPLYCSSACKQAAFYAMNPKATKPKPKVPLEERVAARVYQMLVDANVVTPVEMPPRRKPEHE